MTLDSGSIDLKAERLKDIGYMPQVYDFIMQVLDAIVLLSLCNFKGLMFGRNTYYTRNV